MSSVTIVPSVWVRNGQDGDFGWMLNQPQYGGAFFIFNDNEQQFLDHEADPTGASGCAPGAGNGAIRPWQCTSPPRAGGIPTGTHGGGYTSLTPHVKALVDRATSSIAAVVAAGGFDTVYYSSDGHGGLGTGTFRVADDVKAYIVQQIETLAR